MFNESLGDVGGRPAGMAEGEGFGVMCHTSPGLTRVEEAGVMCETRGKSLHSLKRGYWRLKDTHRVKGLAVVMSVLRSNDELDIGNTIGSNY